MINPTVCLIYIQNEAEHLLAKAQRCEISEKDTLVVWLSYVRPRQGIFAPDSMCSRCSTPAAPAQAGQRRRDDHFCLFF